MYIDIINAFQEHDRSRRFITLVDEVYDAEKRLKWTSEKEIIDLFTYITEEVMELSLVLVVE